MTKEYQPTMQTWRDYAVLSPEEQERIVKAINKKALYGGLEPKLAGRYSDLVRVLEKDEIRVIAENPDLLSILHSFLLPE
ncbi:MAG: hypothetical protein Fur0011_2770 [Candidatus Microgenomates bacterium]